MLRTEFGEVAEVLARPGIELTAVMATWDTTVFIGVNEHGRRAFICVPRDHLRDFIDGFREGDYDDLLRVYWARRLGRRRLQRHAQALRPGLWDALGTRANLLARERPAMTTRSR